MITELQINDVKGPNVTAQIVEMEPETKIVAPIEKSPYIRTLISGTIKYKYQDREYRTEANPDDSTTFFIIRDK
jgi:hypothetical protein